MISARVKVNFKNLIFLFLLVTSCLKVGKYTDGSPQRSPFQQKIWKKCDLTSDLIEKSFALLEIEGWKKRKYQQRVNIKKVGPFCFLNFIFVITKKVVNLLVSKGNNLNISQRGKAYLDKTITSKFSKLFKLFKLLRSLTNLNRILNTQDEVNDRQSKVRIGRKSFNTSRIDLLRSHAISDKDHTTSFVNVLKISIPTMIILGLIIRGLLVQQNVERNPGPTEHNGKDKPNLNILTFNCNGLGNVQKLRRLLSKCNKLVNFDGIVMIQETHLANDCSIKNYWKSNYAGSFFKSNSAGVVTFYGNEYSTIHEEHDTLGRQSFVVIEKGSTKLLLANIYAPNDHNEAINFIEEAY